MAWCCLGAGLALVLIGLSGPANAGQIVAVVLDDSGSMGEPMRRTPRVRKIQAAKSALLAVLNDLPKDAQLGIVLLNGSVQGSSWVVPLGPVDFPKARQAILQVQPINGTPLGKFMKVGADALLEHRAKEFYGDYRLLIVTDGEATDAELVDRYLPEIMARGLNVDVIGVDMPQQHSLATRVHTYRRADDPAALQQAIRTVLAETLASRDDGGESAFEIVATIPDEVATAALKALSESGNQPIGTKPKATPEAKQDELPDESSDAAEGAASATPASSSGQTPPRRRPVGSWFLYAFVFIIFMQLVRGLKRRIRRR